MSCAAFVVLAAAADGDNGGCDGGRAALSSDSVVRQFALAELHDRTGVARLSAASGGPVPARRPHDRRSHPRMCTGIIEINKLIN